MFRHNSHDGQERYWASLRGYIFAPVRMNFPSSRALRKRIRISIHHSIRPLFNTLLVLSLLASPFQASLYAAPTNTLPAPPVGALSTTSHTSTSNIPIDHVFSSSHALAGANTANSANINKQQPLAHSQSPNAINTIQPGTDVFLNQPSLTNNPWNWTCGTHDPEPHCTDKANDGSDSSYWHVWNIFSNIYYWRVDLPNPAAISSIRLVQESDVYATSVDIYGSYTVNSSDNPDDTMVEILANVSVSSGSQVINIPYNIAFNHYYILERGLNNPGTNHDWKLDTVEGIASNQPIPPPGDVFAGQSSTNGAANDGNDATYWRVDNPTSGTSWTVDLPSATAVNKIMILQPPADGFYATSFDILGNNGGSNTTLASNVTGTAGWQTFTFANTTPYFHYLIQANTFNNGGIGGQWRVHTIQGYTNLSDVQPYESYGGGTGVTPDSTCNTCNPVNIATGNFWHTFTDISIPGRSLPLQFGRTYNEQLSNVTGTLTTTMGYGWTHSYNWFIDRDANNNFMVHEGNGSIVPFYPDLSAPTRVMATLTTSSGNYIFSPTHGLDKYYFEPMPGVSNAYRLYQIVDRAGLTTTLSYDASTHLLSAVTDPTSRQLSFSYTLTNTTYFLTEVDNSTSLSVTLGYDGNSNLRNARDVGSQYTSFTYDTTSGYHRLLTMSAPGAKAGPNDTALPQVITNTYDLNNRVVMQTDPMSRTLKFEYTDLGSGQTQTNVTNTLNIATVNRYNHLVPSQSTNHANAPFSAQAATVYNYKLGTPWLSSVVDPLNNKWSYNIDNRGNVISMTDPLTRTTSYVYTSTNDLVTITNTNGVSTTFTYDTKGNPLTISNTLTQTGQFAITTFEYDTNPLRPSDLLTVTNPLGNKWTYGYDTYGYITATTNPLTETTNFTYDTLGRLKTAVSPKGNTTRLAYNRYNDLTSITDPLNYTTTYQYNPNRTLLWLTPPDNQTTSFYYNMDNQPISTTVPGGIINYYAYDNIGRLISQGNALNQSTHYSFDDTRRVITVTDALARDTAYAYDKVGNLVVMTDALSSHLTTTYGYNNAYQLTNVTYHDSGVTPNVSFAYNNLGLRTVMTDGIGVSRYGYDSLNRPITTTDGVGNTITYTYDLGNRLTGVTYPYNGSSVRSVTRSFNNANRLTSVQDWLNNTTNFNYDHDGNLTTLIYPNGVTSTIGYDAADQVISMTHGVTSTTFFSFTNTLDKVGVLTNTTEAASGSQHTYSYDPAYRVTQDSLLTGSGSGTTNPKSNWGYDAATEIVSTTYKPSGSMPNVPITTTRTYNDANQLLTLIEQRGTSAQTTKNLSFAYDNKGNRTQMTDTVSGGGKSYYYDQVNRLTGMSTNSSGEISYAYNGDGLRMQKTVCVINCHPQDTQNFTWDIVAGLPLLLQDGSASFIYGPRGMLLEEITNDGNPYYYHTDRLGSIKALTNSSGARVNTYEYDAYGNRVMQLVGHVSWQGRTAGTSRYQIPLTLTLKMGTTEVNYPSVTTDASGFFTVDVSSFVTGTYNWRVKGPDGVTHSNSTDPPGFLATSGSVDLLGAAITQVDMGTQLGGDCNNDNLVSNTTDFTIYRNANGSQLGDAAYDNRADMNGDQIISTSDFNIMRPNFGLGGAGPIDPRSTGKGKSTGASSTQSTTSPIPQNVYNPFGYAREYNDAESGLLYLRARYYDPSTQQFMSVDPMVGITGQAYNYTGGNPLNNIDPLGLSKESNLNERCTSLMRRITNLQKKIAEREQELIDNILCLPETAPNDELGPGKNPAGSRRGHRRLIAKDKQDLAEAQGDFDGECCGWNPNPVTQPVPVPAPTAAPATDAQQSFSSFEFPQFDPPVIDKGTTTAVGVGSGMIVIVIIVGVVVLAPFGL